MTRKSSKSHRKKPKSRQSSEAEIRDSPAMSEGPKLESISAKGLPPKPISGNSRKHSSEKMEAVEEDQLLESDNTPQVESQDLSKDSRPGNNSYTDSSQHNEEIEGKEQSKVIHDVSKRRVSLHQTMNPLEFALGTSSDNAAIVHSGSKSATDISPDISDNSKDTVLTTLRSSPPRRPPYITASVSPSSTATSAATLISSTGESASSLLAATSANITKRHSIGASIESSSTDVQKLSQEERELLEKLEKQNQILVTQTKMAKAMANVSITSDLNDSGNNYLNDFNEELDSSIDWDYWGNLLAELPDTLHRQATSTSLRKLLIKKIHGGIPDRLRGGVWHGLVSGNPLSFLRFQGSRRNVSAENSQQGSLDSVTDDKSSSNLITANQTSNSNSVKLATTYSSSTSVSSGSAGSGSDFVHVASPLADLIFKIPDAFADISPDQAYRELLKLTSPYEKMITRDLSRTFPMHEFFKTSSGAGQDSLFNIMKAYSLYDSEVGYCQGLSFIGGSLLMHMPEEQAFACMVHLLHTCQLRKLYTPRMELLQLCLYQFDRLVEENLPKVHNHLFEMGIRSTMYASQWFLTLFSYRFPLDFVFRILDLLFAVGVINGIGGVGVESNFVNFMMDAIGGGGSSSAAINQSSHTLYSSSSNILQDVQHFQPVTQADISKYQDLPIFCCAILFKFAFALLKKNESMIIALEFEPLLEFLKNGLFEIYVDSKAETKPPKQLKKSDSDPTSQEFHATTDPKESFKNDTAPRRDSSNTANSSVWDSLNSRHRKVSNAVIDDVVQDAMAIKAVTKKKLLALQKEYEEEIKKNDPLYLAEKNLEAQNQRLQAELKRVEGVLENVSKEQCNVSGQMVSLKIELAKEKETNDLLRRQVEDLKSIISSEPKNEKIAAYSYPPDAKEAIVSETVPIEEYNKIVDEMNEWKSKAEHFEKKLKQNGV